MFLSIEPRKFLSKNKFKIFQFNFNSDLFSLCVGCKFEQFIMLTALDIHFSQKLSIASGLCTMFYAIQFYILSDNSIQKVTTCEEIYNYVTLNKIVCDFINNRYTLVLNLTSILQVNKLNLNQITQSRYQVQTFSLLRVVQ